jgi:hypothetical protein
MRSMGGDKRSSGRAFLFTRPKSEDTWSRGERLGWSREQKMVGTADWDSWSQASARMYRIRLWDSRYEILGGIFRVVMTFISSASIFLSYLWFVRQRCYSRLKRMMVLHHKIELSINARRSEIHFQVIAPCTYLIVHHHILRCISTSFTKTTL